MLRRILVLLVMALLGGSVLAQANGIPALVAQNTEIVTQTDAFGVAQQMMVGELKNNSDEFAYDNIEIYGDVYDADGNAVGEALGYLVDACGSALTDVPLLPGQTRRFSLALDLYEEGVAIDKTEIYADGAVYGFPEGTEEPDLSQGVTRISDQEVVAARWQDDNTLLYGVGCAQQVFTAYTWYDYDMTTGESTPASNPNTAAVDDTFIRQSLMMVVSQDKSLDPSLVDRSFLTFSPDGSQAAYQNDIHVLYMIRSDGSFRRAVHLYLNSYSLQGITWTPRNNFMAYYFGAYGEDVRYVTVNERGILISGVITEAVPSVIVPGMMYDGTRVFIAGTFDVGGKAVTGYFSQNVAANTNPQLLFQTDELPGNNYPAPLYYLKGDDTRYLYIVRPVNGQDMLQCYHLEGETLTDLTPLPPGLVIGEHSWSWISPDGSTLAIAANGINGGLWKVDLTALPNCEKSAS